MVVILNNFSFQLVRCMVSFRDAGIKKQEPLCIAIINSRSNEKKIRESNIPYQYFHLFSVAVGRVRPNIKFINLCGSRLIASRQLLNTIC